VVQSVFQRNDRVIFLPATVTGTSYLEMLQNIMSCINDLSSDEECYFQHDGATPHYHTHVRNFLIACFPGRWKGRKGSVDYPHRSPNLMPLDFYLGDDLKSNV